MYKVLIAESFAIVRTGMFRLLSDNFQDLEITEAASAHEMLTVLKESNSWNLIVVGENVKDPEMSRSIEKIRRSHRSAKILVCSEKFNYGQALHYVSMGVNGYLTKQADNGEFQTAIRNILRNETYLCSEMLDAIVKEKIAFVLSNVKGGVTISNNTSNFSVDAKLSKRQREIVNYLILGERTTGIARILKLSISTVSTHKAQIFHKLRVNNVVTLRDLVMNGYI